MKLAIVASMAVSVSALTGSSAYAQDVSPAELAAALQNAPAVSRIDDGRAVLEARKLNWSGPRPVLQGDRMPAGRVSLAKAPSRVVGTASSVDLNLPPASSDISGALAARPR
jgi:hypothetical protein